MRIKINVTQEDIDKGYKGCPGQCPIARAMERDGYIQPSVNCLAIFFGFDDKRWIGKLTDEMADFVVLFDKGWSVQPQIFETEVIVDNRN